MVVRGVPVGGCGLLLYTTGNPLVPNDGFWKVVVGEVQIQGKN